MKFLPDVRRHAQDERAAALGFNTCCKFVIRSRCWERVYRACSPPIRLPVIVLDMVFKRIRISWHLSS